MRGLWRMARAMETRWRSPPESPAPFLPDLGLIAVGLGHDEIVGVGRTGGRHDVLKRGAGPAVADVLGNGAGKEHRLLQHDADLRAQVAQVDFADVDPVDRNGPVIDVVEAGDEVDGRGLADPRLAHETDHLARLDVQVKVFQHRLALVVAKGDALEANASFHSRHPLSQSGPHKPRAECR